MKENKDKETLDWIQGETGLTWGIDEGHVYYQNDKLIVWYFYEHGGTDLNGMELKENLVCWTNPGMVYIYPETKEDALERIREILG
jgi:hypothetical protein